MRRIGSSDGLFVDGNASNGTPGTIVTAAWLNAVQEEIISVLTAAGFAIDAAKTDQLSTAIATLLRGRATVSVAGGAGVTLTAAQHSLPILILTGALTANINVIFPAISGTWIVRNQTTGAFSVTCKTAAGSGVVVSQGTSNALWGDGTNIYAEQSDWANLALTGTPTAPTATPGSSTTQLANMLALQQAVNGKLTKSVAGGAAVTLTAAEAGYAMLELIGALTANIAVVVPAISGQWLVKNATTGAFTITVKTAAGTGVVIRQGLTQTVWSDGVNVLEADAGKADKADVVSGERQQFTASGSFVVPAGVYRVCVTLAGGGGGGAGAISGSAYVPGGGGAGEVRYREWVAVTPGQSITVTIGAGGAGGIGSTAGGSYSTSNGAAGGASSFGALLTASGGGGGRCQPSDSQGGVAVGTYAADGQDGDSQTVSALGAAGGGNILAPSVYADYNPGGVARGYGSGGGGGRPGTSYWQNGMAGGTGVCIVEW